MNRVALAILLGASSLAAQSTPSRPDSATTRVILRAGRGTVRLDGMLTDAAWATADSIASLTQTEPREGTP
jgi:hypothetical protein